MSAAIDKKAGNTSIGSPAVSPRRKSQQLGINARKVVSKRYSLKDLKGRPLEEWADIVRRVVGHVSMAETGEKRDKFFAAMSEVMLDREFIPNTPCLVNAGKSNGQLAACFVLNVPDSISGIMEHAKAAATIHQTGGGTGMTYEFLRPAGAMVSSTRGVASGPVSFMNIVNQVTDVVKQGDYAIYRRQDGSTVTFRDRAAFEQFEQSEKSSCVREEPPRPGMVYA